MRDQDHHHHNDRGVRLDRDPHCLGLESSLAGGGDNSVVSRAAYSCISARHSLSQLDAHHSISHRPSHSPIHLHWRRHLLSRFPGALVLDGKPFALAQTRRTFQNQGRMLLHRHELDTPRRLPRARLDRDKLLLESDTCTNVEPQC